MKKAAKSAQPNSEAQIREIQRSELIGLYNEYVIAYKISGNGLLLWQALALCHREGLEIQKDLLDRFAEYAAKLVLVAQKKGVKVSAYAEALELFAGAREFSAWEIADRRWRLVRSIRRMNQMTRPPFCWSVPEAAKAFADLARVTPKTLEKQYSIHMEKPTADWRDPKFNPFTAHKAPLPKKRKAQ